jgi:hypothetical protein
METGFSISLLAKRHEVRAICQNRMLPLFSCSINFLNIFITVYLKLL